MKYLSDVYAVIVFISGYSGFEIYSFKVSDVKSGTVNVVVFGFVTPYNAAGRDYFSAYAGLMQLHIMKSLYLVVPEYVSRSHPSYRLVESAYTSL